MVLITVDNYLKCFAVDVFQALWPQVGLVIFPKVILWDEVCGSAISLSTCSVWNKIDHIIKFWFEVFQQNTILVAIIAIVGKQLLKYSLTSHGTV